MCKWSDPFSKCVLIDRGLDHNSLEFSSQWQNVSSDYSVLKARPSKNTGQENTNVLYLVSHIGRWRWRWGSTCSHSEHISSLVPKIVRWKRRVKIGSRRLKQNLWGRNSLGFVVFVRYFLSPAKKLPKVFIFSWFFRALCYDDIGDAGWPIPFYNDVLSSDLGSAYSTLDRRKEIRKDWIMKRAIFVLLSVVLMLGVLCSCSTNDKAADDSVQTTTSSHHSGHHAEPGEPNHHK